MPPMADGRGRDFGPRGGRGVPPPGIATGGDLWARGKGFQPSAGGMGSLEDFEPHGQNSDVSNSVI